MITNIIRMKSKMDIQQTTAMIDIVLAIHKLNKAVQRHIAIHRPHLTSFSYFSIFVDIKALRGARSQTSTLGLYLLYFFTEN